MCFMITGVTAGGYAFIRPYAAFCLFNEPGRAWYIVMHEQLNMDIYTFTLLRLILQEGGVLHIYG